jgi:hypothetical protein
MANIKEGEWSHVFIIEIENGRVGFSVAGDGGL